MKRFDSIKTFARGLRDEAGPTLAEVMAVNKWQAHGARLREILDSD